MTRPNPKPLLAACLLVLPVFLAASTTARAAQPADAGASTPMVVVDDVARFYRIYDSADGHPSADQLQRDYLDTGSEGLRHLARLRKVTGARIAEALKSKPEMYVEARRCMRVLPQVRERLTLALDRLRTLYPQARMPPVTIAVGRGKPVGIGYPDTGLQIGLEALCAVKWMNPDVEDRFVHVIAHEYAHVQLAPETAALEKPTVLERALVEGAAEFIAELISGQVAYTHLGPLTRGREKQLETAFVADMHGTDFSRWLDNASADTPGDLGYWVGYRIVKAYYRNAPDKQRAIGEILRMADPKGFFAASGWQPGMSP